MADISLSKNNLPFLLSGNGTLNVHAKVPKLDRPLAATDADLLSVDFGAQGDKPFTFGVPNTVKLGIQAQAANHLFAIFPGSSPDRVQLLADHGLDGYFDHNPDHLILALVLDATAAAQVAGSFSYSALTASLTLDAGGNVGYTYLRPFLNTAAAGSILPEFFANLRLPAHVTSAMPLGEVLAFAYGGYLKFGAGLSVGYELKGAPSFDISQLRLSEHYQLSVIGKLAVNAQIAGNFAIEARSATDADGHPMEDWVRVIVRKHRASALQIAADVGVDASSDLEGLPDSGDEFIEALLGLRAKNWLNMFARVRQFTDLQTLKGDLDDLAMRFLTEWTGKAFDRLSTTEFAEILARVQKVVDSYENLDNSAITLFDRYFDKLDFLTAQLTRLASLTSWDNLKGEMDGSLWEIVRQLTDGDPLSWILGQIQVKGPDGKPVSIPTLAELKDRVQQTLDLIQNKAHQEIREVIALAKSKFPLDGFIDSLSKVDSIPELKALADQKLGAFVERLLGQAVDQIKNSELGSALNRIHQVLESIHSFEDKLYAKFKQAVHQSFSFKLHAEYNRASERDALIDVMINVSTNAGRQLMQAAGRGDFQDILAAYRPEIVRLNSGLLTHKVTRESSLDVNILGWHGGWHYLGVDRVIVETEQQIVAENNGGLSVYTNIDLSDERVRQRNSEKVQTNFLLRFIGESHRVLKFDTENQQYLIDAITGMSASYELSFSGTKTTARRLQYYLSVASDFGLTQQGATFQQLLPLLPTTKPGVDDFGPVTADYQVRYTTDALQRLFGAPFDEGAVRTVSRKTVLASYLRQDGLEDLGWCYWTPGIYNLWKKGQAAFTNHSTGLVFKPIAKSPFPEPAPASVTLTQTQLHILSTLFFIEDSLVAGLAALDSLIHKGEISPRDFEKALGNIAGALNELQDFSDGVNTLFAIVDQLVSLQIASSQARASSLTLTSQVGNETVTKVFLAGPDEDGGPVLEVLASKPPKGAVA